MPNFQAVGIAASAAGSIVASVGANQATGNGLFVNVGRASAVTTLNAVTGNATGTSTDEGVSRQHCSIVAVGTSTLTGTLTIFASVDGTTFVSTGVSVALTAGATVTATASNMAFRHWRVDFSGAAGSGSVTCKLLTHG